MAARRSETVIAPDMEGLISLLGSHPYMLLFPLAFLEGPVATVCAGFLVSAGLMDWPLALALALVVVADLAADSLYYALGRSGLHPRTGGILDRFGLSDERTERLRSVIARNGPKAIVGAKVVDLFAIPVFVAAGLARMGYRRFLVWDLAVTLPKSVALLCLGFFFGMQVEPYLGFGTSAAVLISVAVMAGLAITALKKLRFKEDEVEGLDR